MSATALLQFVIQALYLLAFAGVLVTAWRSPRRATIDTALLFGALALIIALGAVGPALRVVPTIDLTDATSILLMALPYLLLRLVDDFAGTPWALMRGAELGLAAAIAGIIFTTLSKDPVWLSLLYVAYFVAIEVYAGLAFARAARDSSGVTRRRMQAVAAGSLLLGLVIVLAGVQIALPAQGHWLSALSTLCALGSGLGYYIGFAPPRWLRRAWQEPEVRAFLGRAARLPRLPTTAAIVAELERGAAASLGAPHAAISLWVEQTRALWTAGPDGPVETAPDAGIAGRAFATQRALFWTDPARQDPLHAELYRARGANALLAAPITAGETRLGVLVVYAARPSIFAEDDLVLARLLADQAAVILESRALIDAAARVQARAEATRLKDDFLSAAAHDLKTPLTTLIAQAQLLEHRARRDPTAPADSAGIARMVRESQRLRRLVEDLLDGARMDSGALVGARAPVDLAALAAEACTRHNTPRHPCRLDAAEPVVGMYDATSITRLLDNLIENAIKYSPDGGEVCVSVRREGDEAVLSVADRGIGIPAGDLPHLFERFHRGANVDDRRFAGMGLGLYICRGIVEGHGGRLWATSAGKGGGSAFHVTLPLEIAADKAAATQDEQGSAATAATQTSLASRGASGSEVAAGTMEMAR